MNQAPLNIFKQLGARTRLRLMFFQSQTTAAKVNLEDNEDVLGVFRV